MVKQCIEAVEQVNRKRNKWKRDLCFVLLFKEEIFSIIWNGDVFRILCSKKVHVQYLVKKRRQLEVKA